MSDTEQVATEFQVFWDEIGEVAKRHGIHIETVPEREEVELANSLVTPMFTGNTLVRIEKGQKILEYRVRRVDRDSVDPCRPEYRVVDSRLTVPEL